MRPVDALRRYRRIVMLVLGLATLCAWQRLFASPEARIDQRYRVTASTGINRERDFVFYLHHLGLFPIATDAEIKADTAEEARALLHDAPEMLKQDQDATFRSGDRGRTFLYLVDVWLHKSSINPSLRPAHAFFFTLALCALFTAFWGIRKPAWGAVLCVLLGSNPWQLYAVYKQENVFSWPITTMIALLAINLPVMWPRRPRWYLLFAAIASGVTLAFMRTFRSEGTPLLLAPILMLATAEGLTLRLRALAVVGTVLAFVVASWGSLKYLDYKLEESKAVVASVGGSPYAAPVIAYHEVWHPIFCGFGDFDKKYGYEWNDIVAYRYAHQYLQPMHPDLPLDPETTFQTWFWDDAQKYPYFYPEAPGYHDIIREKVLGDIKRDPGWFLTIIMKRIARVFTHTTPVAIASRWGHNELGGPLLGIVCVPLAVYLVVVRRWFLLKLLVFSFPLSVAPIAVYSGGGMTCYTTFHLFGVFIIGLLAWEKGQEVVWPPLRAAVLKACFSWAKSR